MLNSDNFKQHPIYKNYICDIEGSVLKSNLSSIKNCAIESLHDYKCKNYIYEIGIIINPDYGCKTIYPKNKLIWECFKGLIPSNKTVILKDKNGNRSIRNLKCIDYEYFPCNCKEQSLIMKDSRSGVIYDIKKQIDVFYIYEDEHFTIKIDEEKENYIDEFCDDFCIHFSP